MILSLQEYFSERRLLECVAVGSQRHCGEILVLYLARENKELLFQEELLPEISRWTFL